MKPNIFSLFAIAELVLLIAGIVIISLYYRWNVAGRMSEYTLVNIFFSTIILTILRRSKPTNACNTPVLFSLIFDFTLALWSISIWSNRDVEHNSIWIYTLISGIYRWVVILSIIGVGWIELRSDDGRTAKGSGDEEKVVERHHIWGSRGNIV
jgi:hypothetical protein